MSLGIELEPKRVASRVRRFLGGDELNELVFPLRQGLFTRREFLLERFELLASHQVERGDWVDVDAEPDDGIGTRRVVLRRRVGKRAVGEPGGRGIASAGVRRIRRLIFLVVDVRVRLSTIYQRRLGRELNLALLQPRSQRVHLLLQPPRAQAVIHLLLHHERVGHLERALAEGERRDRLREVLRPGRRGDDQRRHRGSPSESFSKRVSFDSLYGTCKFGDKFGEGDPQDPPLDAFPVTGTSALEASAAMHLPSACRWRLIAMASSNVWPSAPLFPTRSLPARSTRSSLPFSTLTLRSFVGAFDAFIVDAFVDAFVVVSEPSAPRPTRPTFRRTVTDSNACDLDDAALSKWFATARFLRTRHESLSPIARI